MPNELTVSQLVAELREHHDNGALPAGWSKLRKAELLELLEALRVSARRAPKASKERRLREKGSRVGRRFGTKNRANRQDPRNVHHKVPSAA